MYIYIYMLYIDYMMSICYISTIYCVTCGCLFKIVRTGCHVAPSLGQPKVMGGAINGDTPISIVYNGKS